MQYFPFVLSSDDEGEQLARAVAFSQLIERLPERPLEELAGNVALISGDRAWRYCAVVSSCVELTTAQ